MYFPAEISFFVQPVYMCLPYCHCSPTPSSSRNFCLSQPATFNLIWENKECQRKVLIYCMSNDTSEKEIPPVSQQGNAAIEFSCHQHWITYMCLPSLTPNPHESKLYWFHCSKHDPLALRVTQVQHRKKSNSLENTVCLCWTWER